MKVLWMLLFASSTAWSAQYVVPATVAGGAPTTYSGVSAALNGAPGARVLTFALPEDLAGQGEKFTLNEMPAVPGFTAFASPDLTAVCSQGQSNSVCVMNYASSYSKQLNRDTIDQFLKTKFAADPKALSSALELSRDFQRDPEGVLIF